MIDEKLLSILVCPVSKAPLEYDREKQELICRASGLAYPIRDDIPVMLESEARQLSAEEKLSKYAARPRCGQSELSRVGRSVGLLGPAWLV